MQTLDKHFRDMTKAAFTRFGFAYGDLLRQWPAIMGEVAAYARPEKIKGPKGAGEDAQKLGGTLVLTAAPGRALDLQHQAPFILERVNGFLGHGAITAVKVIQGQAFPKPRARRDAPRLTETAAAALDIELSPIADEPLKSALRRLGAGVLQSRRSPQPS